MRKYKGGLTLVLLAVSLVLSGCGNSMFELTSKEETLIVNYAAYIVGKYNIYQKDGITRLPEEEPETESEEDSENGTESTEPEKPSVPTITIEESFGLAKGLKLNYTGYEIADHVQEGAGYAADAGEGFSFYIMKFELENTSKQPITVDHLLKHPTFMFKAGEVSSKSYVTFLSKDLMSYQGTVNPGEKVETILLFKIKSADAESIKNPILQITVNDVTKNVEL